MKIRYILFIFLISAGFVQAATLSVTGSANSACNDAYTTPAKISVPVSETNRSFYITNAWIGGNGEWDDQIGFSGTLNGRVVVDTTAGWAKGCDKHAAAGSGYTGFFPLSMTGSTDSDSFKFSLLGLQKRDEIS